MTKHKGARGVEVAATFIAVIIITLFAVLPQFLTLPKLGRIKNYARLAAQSIDDEGTCRNMIYAVSDEIKEDEFLFLLCYSSADVSDLELATDRALQLCGLSGEKAHLLKELCNIYSAADTLAEKEHLSLSNIF